MKKRLMRFLRIVLAAVLLHFLVRQPAEWSSSLRRSISKAIACSIASRPSTTTLRNFTKPISGQLFHASGRLNPLPANPRAMELSSFTLNSAGLNLITAILAARSLWELRLKPAWLPSAETGRISRTSLGARHSANAACRSRRTPSSVHRHERRPAGMGRLRISTATPIGIAERPASNRWALIHPRPIPLIVRPIADYL